MAWASVAGTLQEGLWQKRPKDGLSGRKNQFAKTAVKNMTEEDGNNQVAISIVERRILPYLEASGWEEKYGLKENGLAKSRRALAEEYWEAGQAFMNICFGVMFGMVILDHIFYIEPIIYGLMVNVAGAAAIFFSGVRDPAMISAVVDADISEAKREIEARKMAYHNSGFGLLFVGFSLQLVAIAFLPETQLIQWNIFLDGLPGLRRGGVLVILGLIFYHYCLP